MTLDALTAWVDAEARRRRRCCSSSRTCTGRTRRRCELIGRLLDAPDDVPLLFVATSRGAGDRHRARARRCWRSSGSASRTRASSCRSATDQVLDPALVDQITAQADGVPLFVEEMTRTLVATGEDGIEGVVPTTLYGCLMARLDRDPDARAVAQAAAAIGRRFDTGLLGPLTGLGEDELRERLDSLVADDLLVEQRGDTGVTAYVFRHALIREAARNSLLRARHQELHGRRSPTCSSSGRGSPRSSRRCSPATWRPRSASARRSASASRRRCARSRAPPTRRPTCTWAARSRSLSGCPTDPSATASSCPRGCWRA